MQSVESVGSALGLPPPEVDPVISTITARLSAALNGKSYTPQNGPALNNRPDTNISYSEPLAPGQQPAPYGISNDTTPSTVPIEVVQAKARAGAAQMQRDRALQSRTRLISALNDEQNTLQEIQSKQPSNRELKSLQRLADPTDLFSPLYSAQQAMQPLQDRINRGDRISGHDQRVYRRLSGALAQADDASKALQAVAGVNQRVKDVRAQKQAALDDAEGISNAPPLPTPDQAGQAAQFKLDTKKANADKRTAKEQAAAEKAKAADIKSRKSEARSEFDRQLQAGIQLSKTAKAKLAAIDAKSTAWAKTQGIPFSERTAAANKRTGKIGANWKSFKAQQDEKVAQMQMKKAAGADAVPALHPDEQAQIAEYQKRNPDLDPAVVEKAYRKFKGLE